MNSLKALLIVTALVSSPLWAHGPVAKQALAAANVAIGEFLTTQPKEISQSFLSVAATMTGHEKVRVKIATQNGAKEYSYDCEEDENEEPVIWLCR